MNKHSYDQFKGQKDSSEHSRLQEINHFTDKISHEVFRKTPEEKQLLKTRMYAYPNKNHCPVPPNN